MAAKKQSSMLEQWRGASWRTLTARILCTLLLVGLLPGAVVAYTIVMRGGRRIEAPDSFAVTQTTLTYEAAPGLNVTLQLSQVDIAATDQANGEQPGSLLRRAAGSTPPAPKRQTPHARPAARTLTNRELEPARRARMESERVYEQRRRDLGLPTVEEERRREQEQARALRELAARHTTEQAQAENYWRARATDLRVNMAALDAEIDYLRARLPLLPDNFTPGYGALITTGSTFFSPHTIPFAASPGSISVNSFSTSTQLGGSLAIGGGATRGRGFFNQQTTKGTFHKRFVGAPGLFAAPVAVLAVPFDYASADTTALRIRLAELEAARAGLDARWQQLEDEARRAGALPGWLR